MLVMDFLVMDFSGAAVCLRRQAAV